MKCPRCKSKVSSHEWSMYVTCSEPKCGAMWTYEEYVDEVRTMRLVWVFTPKSAYLRLCDKDELKDDGSITLDGVKCRWKPFA